MTKAVLVWLGVVVGMFYAVASAAIGLITLESEAG